MARSLPQHRRAHEQHTIVSGAGKPFLGALDDLLGGVRVFADRIVVGGMPVHPGFPGPNHEVPFEVFEDDAEFGIGQRHLLSAEKPAPFLPAAAVSRGSLPMAVISSAFGDSA
jgi:hypothetical protein